MENNFYADIKSSIGRHFGFLKKRGFPDFEERQLAHEYHFETRNSHVLFAISFEAIPCTSIWASINEYPLDNLELKNPGVEAYTARLKENYDELFDQYLQTREVAFLNRISEQYARSGKDINDRYLKELSDILKRNSTVLDGKLEELKSNTELVHKKYELKQAADRIEKGIYTLEYQFFSTDDYDCYKEFDRLEEIEKYLAEQDEIKKYRILDCRMNEISLK